MPISGGGAPHVGGGFGSAPAPIESSRSSSAVNCSKSNFQPELKAERALTSEEGAAIEAAAKRKSEIEKYRHAIKVIRLDTIRKADGREEPAALMRFPGAPGAHQMTAGSEFDRVKVIRISYEGAIVDVDGEKFLIAAPPDSQ